MLQFILITLVVFVIVIIIGFVYVHIVTKPSNATTSPKPQSTNAKVTNTDIVDDNNPREQLAPFISVGNLVFEKKYEEAIALGEKLLQSSQTLNKSMLYINLMEAYTKNHDVENSNKYAKLSLLDGHNTGLALKRLAINLEKQGYYYQALQVCNLLLIDEYECSSHGVGNTKEFREDFQKRVTRLTSKLAKSSDTEETKFFTDDEKQKVLEAAKNTNIEEKKEIERQNARLEKMRKELGF